MKKINYDEIEDMINTIESSPLTRKLIKVKMNQNWIQEQISKGTIRKEDYRPNGENFFAGIRIEITDEVDNYEFIYED